MKPDALIREYYGERPCIPRGAMAELNCRLRPMTRHEGETRLSPAVIPHKRRPPFLKPIILKTERHGPPPDVLIWNKETQQYEKQPFNCNQ